MEPASDSKRQHANIRVTPVEPKDLPDSFTLSSKRRSVIRNAGPHIPQLSVKDFFARFVPRISINPKQFKSIHTRVVRNAYHRGRWLSFPVDPAKNPASEHEAFLGLVDIARAVRDAAIHFVPRLGSEVSTYFECIPDTPPDSSNRINQTRPDGHFVRIDPRSRSTDNPHWVDIALTGEVKKCGTSKKQLTYDIRKALWSMHHTLREDASRRFTFAFTIENRTMRLWFASRSEILVSASFDFMKDTNHLVQFFLAFTFASEEQLGWDSTMKCLWDGVKGHPFNYDITVRDMNTSTETVWRTQELLSDVGADHIRGRGTRVWRVRKVLDADTDTLEDVDRVLKDAWVDSTRQREGKILADIWGSTEDKEVLAQLKDFLLTVVTHGDVYIGKFPDHTIDGDHRDKVIKNNKVRFHLNHVSPNNTQSSSTNLEDGAEGRPTVIKIDQPVGDFRDPPPVETPQEAVEPIYYSSKSHYRIVFEEVCVPLYRVTSLRDLVFMLIKACVALNTLHSLGWVHRDISEGNILLLNDQVKLADLEYAKLLTREESSHDIRTGTEAFMSIEVQAQAYCFAPMGASKFVSNRPAPSTLAEFSKLTRKRSDRPEPVAYNIVEEAIKEGWFYNPLHDMESVVWLFGRKLLYQDHYLVRLPDRPVSQVTVRCGDKTIDLAMEETPEERLRRIKAYYHFGRHLFVDRDRGGRVRTMYDGQYLRSQLAKVPLLPPVRPLGSILSNMRENLVNQYKKQEANVDEINHTCAEDLHLAFVQDLHVAYDYLNDINDGGYEIMVRSLQSEFELLTQEEKDPSLAPSTVSAGSKRARVSAEDGGDEVASRPSKSPRTSASGSPRQSSAEADLPAHPAPLTPGPLSTPQPLSSPPSPVPQAPRRRGKITIAASTRTLRSHVRKVAVLESVPSPPILAAPSSPKRPRKSASITARRGKATKNHEVMQAAAKVAVKSKTRKGR